MSTWKKVNVTYGYVYLRRKPRQEWGVHKENNLAFATIIIWRTLLVLVLYFIVKFDLLTKKNES